MIIVLRKVMFAAREMSCLFIGLSPKLCLHRILLTAA